MSKYRGPGAPLASRVIRERLVLFVGAPALLIALAGDWVTWLQLGDYSTVGMDFELYRDAAARWLSGGAFYGAYQLAGPYVVSHGDILYPPTALVLFVPFTLLPAILWWAIPTIVVLATTLPHRPRPLALLGIVFCIALPTSAVKLVHGNPAMWVVAALALGTLWGWPAVGVLIKPTLAPFALIGARRRSWWLALSALGILSLAFLPMWGDYLRALANARDPAGPLYSLNDVPLLWVPILAWLGGRRSPLNRAGPATRAAPPRDPP